MHSTFPSQQFKPISPENPNTHSITSLPPISHLLSQNTKSKNGHSPFDLEAGSLSPLSSINSSLNSSTNSRDYTRHLPSISDILNSGAKRPRFDRSSNSPSVSNHIFKVQNLNYNSRFLSSSQNQTQKPLSSPQSVVDGCSSNSISIELQNPSLSHTNEPKKKKSSIGTTFCVNCKTMHTPLWRRDDNNQQVCNACGLYQKSYKKIRPVPEIKLKLNEELLSEALKQLAATTAKSSNSSNKNHHNHNHSVDSTDYGTNYSSSNSNKNEISGTNSHSRSHPSSIPGFTSGSNSNSNSNSNSVCLGNGECNGMGGGLICNGCPTLNQQLIQNGTVAMDRRVRLKKNMGETVCFNCKAIYTPLWRRDDNMNIICNACGLYYKLHKEHRPVSMKRNVIKRRSRSSNSNNTTTASVSASASKLKTPTTTSASVSVSASTSTLSSSLSEFTSRASASKDRTLKTPTNQNKKPLLNYTSQSLQSMQSQSQSQSPTRPYNNQPHSINGDFDQTTHNQTRNPDMDMNMNMNMNISSKERLISHKKTLSDVSNDNSVASPKSTFSFNLNYVPPHMSSSSPLLPNHTNANMNINSEASSPSLRLPSPSHSSRPYHAIRPGYGGSVGSITNNTNSKNNNNDNNRVLNPLKNETETGTGTGTGTSTVISNSISNLHSLAVVAAESLSAPSNFYPKKPV